MFDHVFIILYLTSPLLPPFYSFIFPPFPLLPPSSYSSFFSSSSSPTSLPSLLTHPFVILPFSVPLWSKSDLFRRSLAPREAPGSSPRPFPRLSFVNLTPRGRVVRCCSWQGIYRHIRLASSRCLFLIAKRRSFFFYFFLQTLDRTLRCSWTSH